MTLKKTIRNSIAATVAALLSAQGPALAKSNAAARPALWEVSDADTRVYLFGTIHLLPKGTEWQTSALDEAMSKADTLVLETIVGDDPAATAKIMMTLGMSAGLPPLAERVPADKREALKKLIEPSGYPATVLDKLETWAAALTLISLSYARMGFSSDRGVEKSLTARYQQAKKPVVGLETVEQQLGFFDKLPEGDQRALLVSALDDDKKGMAEFQQMLNAWRRGDVKAIARTFDAETDLTPELRDVLMRNRNKAWAGWIAERMKQPGTIFIAVGAGHLAGPDSVQSMLAARGLRAKRVE